MEIVVVESMGNVTCVRLQGRLDAAGADAIGTRFTAAVVSSGRNAIVDLSGVTFVASLGLRLLIAAARSLQLKGASLALFGAPALVQEVFDQSALNQIIPIVSTEKEALERVGA
jgi:anti-sigma B factor antagonist